MDAPAHASNAQTPARVAVAPAELGHPARLGKYQITRVIGQGAMGRVYQALDPLLQRYVALKAIRAQLLRDESTQPAQLSLNERFRIEAQAAGRLSHPGIVAVHEYGEDDGTAYIAMEYVRGRTLTQCLENPLPMSEDDALSVAVQVLEALHHAHELGVWHRDIKPGNLIVTADGCVKVTDFGIARLESSCGLSHQQTLLLIGSPGYIAPERYTGQAPDRRVDIFSCGVLIYQLLTGLAPFAGSASEVMYQVLHSDPVPPSRTAGLRGSSISDYDAVVRKALARRPEDRYATALELRDALLSVARRPVSRRLSSRAATGAVAGATANLRSAQDGPSSPRLRVPASNVFEMPTQRVGRGPAASRPSASRSPDPPPTLGDAKAPRPPFPPGSLRAVEAALIEQMGPIAPVLVQRALARCHDLPSLLRHLASQGLGARERRAFLSDAKRRTGVDAGPPDPQDPRDAALAAATSPPVLDDAPTLIALRPQTVARAETLLTGKIGPIATVLVRRALALSSDRLGFFLALAEESRSCLDRNALLRALQRLE